MQGSRPMTKKEIQKSTNTEDHLFEKISTLIHDSRMSIARSVNQIMVQTYWTIGKEIVEEEQKGQERAEYGKALIKNLSKRLTEVHGKGFSVSNLRYFRQFYYTYPKYHTVCGELSWSHYRLLIRIEEETKRLFYEVETIKNNWSTRELERQMNAMLYERVALSKDRDGVKELAQKGIVYKTPQDLVKDPYVLEFLGLRQDDKLYESTIESGLIEHLQKFLLELGRGFTFVARQKRLSLGGEHFYIDLVFYNYLLRCFVLIDLKSGRLTHQDLGQMQMYVNYYTRELMNDGDNKPIGIVLCAEKNDAIVKYTLPDGNEQIFSSKYKLYLPTEEELKAELLKEKDILEQIKLLHSAEEE